MATKNQILAYLAGCIDSDGTIGIKKSSYSVRIVKDSGQPVYSERLSLRQVSPEVPNLLKDTFGGSVYITKPSTERGKNLHSWQITDKKASECLRHLLPFLRIKREQAINCLKLREIKEKSKKIRTAKGRGHKGSKPRPKEISQKMESLYQKAKQLNKTGI